MAFTAPRPFVAAGLLACLLTSPASAGEPGDRVLVTGWNSNNVLTYNAAGTFTGSLLTAAHGVSLAHSMVIGPDGHVYVTSFGNDTIRRVDMKTGTNLGAFVTTGLGGLNGPSNATFGPDGNLYVTGLLSGALYVYDQSGASLGPLITGLNDPESVVFKTDGNILIVSGAGNNVLEFNPAGVFQGVFVSPGNGLSDPHDAVFGPDGNLYVSSFGAHKVIAYNGATGAFIDVFVEDDPGTGIDESGGLTSAHGLEFGRDGDLYVASFGTNQVLHYNGATGAFIDVFIGAGNGLSGTTDVLFPITGDLDNDGVVGISDFLDLLAQWGACPAPCPASCLADIDGDCTVGIVDFLALLGNWG